MATAPFSPPAVARPAAARAADGRSLAARARRLAAGPFLVGVVCSFLGFAWDVQWHVDVGPDTFFTMPHVVLYSGIALSGLVCLGVVLATTAAARRGEPAAFAGTTAVLRGAYRAPVGYLIGGFGALSFLLYGALDQWWHSLYGFDVTLVSPPHVGLILSIFVTMVGALVAFAADDRRAPSFAGAARVALAAAVLAAFLTPMLLDSVPWRLGPFGWPGLAVAVLYPATLLAVVSVLRRPWAGTLFGVAFSGLLAVSWVLVPWVTVQYAGAIGLFLRDTTTNEPVVPGMLPTFVLIAGVAVDGWVLLARRRGWPVRLGVLAAGALAATILVGLQPQPPLYGPDRTDSADVAAIMAEIAAATRAPTLLLAPVLGALAGWFGWNLGVVLRRSEPSEAASAAAAAEARPVAAGSAAG
jgi:hypothetical protein